MKKKHEGTAGGSSFTEQFERNGRLVTRQIDEIDNMIDEIDNIACDHDCDNCPCQGVCKQEGGNDE